MLLPHENKDDQAPRRGDAVSAGATEGNNSRRSDSTPRSLSNKAIADARKSAKARLSAWIVATSDHTRGLSNSVCGLWVTISCMISCNVSALALMTTLNTDPMLGFGLVSFRHACTEMEANWNWAPKWEGRRGNWDYSRLCYYSSIPPSGTGCGSDDCPWTASRDPDEHG